MIKMCGWFALYTASFIIGMSDNHELKGAAIGSLLFLASTSWRSRRRKPLPKARVMK